MPRTNRIPAAGLTGLAWAGAAFVVTLIAEAAFTHEPTTAPDGAGGTVSLKRSRPEGSGSGLSVAAVVVGVAAGFAGAVWGYTRPGLAFDADRAGG